MGCLVKIAQSGGFLRRKLMIGSLMCSWIFATAGALLSQSPLGSTRTAEEIQDGAKQSPISAKPVGEMDGKEKKVVVLHMEGEAEPAFRYRFYPNARELKGSEGSVFFARATLQYQMLGKDTLTDWMQLQKEWDENQDYARLREMLKRFEGPRHELRRMAYSRQLRWDLHLEEMYGTELWKLMLHEMQVARDLARVLRFTALEQIERGDFEGMSETLTVGFRLAQVVGTGRTVVEQLVGIAIQGMMYEVVWDAIQQDSPNFYWALGAMPEIVDLKDSVQFELESVCRALPILNLSTAENANDYDWKKLWGDSVEAAKELEALGIQSELLVSSMSMTLLGGSGEARKQLKRLGYGDEELDGMPEERVIALATRMEIETLGGEAMKGACLNRLAAGSWQDRFSNRFDEALRKLGPMKLSGAIASLLMPAISQACMAEMRIRMVRARLMTVEAIRMHAASQGGRVPKSLQELSVVPAIEDPYTGQEFGYSTTPGEDRTLVTIRSGAPVQLTEYHVLTFQLAR